MPDKASDLRDLAAKALALAQRAGEPASRLRLTVIAQKLNEMAGTEDNPLEHTIKNFTEHIIKTTDFSEHIRRRHK
jgi:hypothetical protein